LISGIPQGGLFFRVFLISFRSETKGKSSESRYSWSVFPCALFLSPFFNRLSATPAPVFLGEPKANGLLSTAAVAAAVAAIMKTPAPSVLE